MHFRHPRTDALPLLMLHGWPGSFIELLDAAQLLARDFHVVVPSLPGYGFSAAAEESGMSNQRIAQRKAELMSSLGYERFAAQGGDWGAGIATWLARQFPERVAALPLNYIPGSYAPPPSDDLSDGDPSIAIADELMLTNGSSAATTSCAGRSWSAVATSRRWKSPSCSPTTSPRFYGAD